MYYIRYNVLENMIELWEPRKQQFNSLKSPSRILENFFKSDDSLVIVTFLHSALVVFKKWLFFYKAQVQARTQGGAVDASPPTSPKQVLK